MCRKHDPKAVDEYLASLLDDERNTLQELRKLIEATVPEVEERISHGTTVIFALKRDLVGFAAQKKHLSFFTISPELARAMQEGIEKTHRLVRRDHSLQPREPPAGVAREGHRAGQTQGGGRQEHLGSRQRAWFRAEQERAGQPGERSFSPKAGIYGRLPIQAVASRSLSAPQATASSLDDRGCAAAAGDRV
jgi:hypothetical protein